MAAHVRTRPAGGRGGGDARRAARHGEEPRPPGPAPAARRPASSRGGNQMNGPPDDIDLGRVWISVATQVWHRQPGWLERMAARLLRSPGLARAVLTTPSLLVTAR